MMYFGVRPLWQGTFQGIENALLFLRGNLSYVLLPVKVHGFVIKKAKTKISELVSRLTSAICLRVAQEPRLEEMLVIKCDSTTSAS